jgi:hypothetical protein
MRTRRASCASARRTPTEDVGRLARAGSSREGAAPSAKPFVATVVTKASRPTDVFRDDLPALGPEQWTFIEHVFANLPPDVEALAVVTPTPIASMDPDGQVMKLVGGRTDRVEASSGAIASGSSTCRTERPSGNFALAAVSARVTRLTGTAGNLGVAVRQPQCGRPAQLMFLSGDIHIGCIFDLTSRVPPFKAVSDVVGDRQHRGHLVRVLLRACPRALCLAYRTGFMITQASAAGTRRRAPGCGSNARTGGASLSYPGCRRRNCCSVA